MEKIINDGYLGTGRKDSDYIAGVLPYQVRLPSGDWRPYIPGGEKQSNWKADSMSCVSFSAINSIETQEKFLTGRSKNYSDRWIAKMSGTTPNGNYLIKVIDTIREYGLVLEEDYPTPKEPWTWNDYHAPIPEPLLSQLKAKGQKWKKEWAVSYEWVDIFFKPEELHKALMHAPLQMVFPDHAVEGVEKTVWYFDTYDPFLKTKQKAEFTSVLKIVLTPLKGQRMSNAKLVKTAQGGYGWYLEDINPSALISSGLHFGREIPKNPDGSVNFTEVDKMVEGEVTLN